MIDEISQVASALKLSPGQVRATAELLDGGNTIPFIARFRKDLTGGLDPEQIQAVKQRLASLRALAERKSFVLRSIESQGGLTPEIEKAIQQASTARHVEDIYLPFKARKQSLALTARQQGLEPLADDILADRISAEEAAAAALQLVRVDKGLNSAADVMNGVRHLLAERFADRSDLRDELRTVFCKTGVLTCRMVAAPIQPEPATAASLAPASAAADSAGKAPLAEAGAPAEEGAAAPADTTPPDSSAGNSGIAKPGGPRNETAEPAVSSGSDVSQGSPPAPESGDESLAGSAGQMASDVLADDSGLTGSTSADASEPAADAADPAASHATASSTGSPASPATDAPPPDAGQNSRSQKSKRGKKKKKEPENPFRDFGNFEQPIQKVPHHRVLAVNRGERAGHLKARIRPDLGQIESIAIARLVPAEHRFADLLAECVRDALNRYILPSLEREARREMTEAAEAHAVHVFANNLRALLLQPPVDGKQILAIDPGYKSGCFVAVVDPRGTLLASDRISIVGGQARRDESRARLARIVRDHAVDAIAIGNGAASREVEQLVSDTIIKELADRRVQYVVVNEAGASVYSTSEIGKEELPAVQPGVRSAVSIARRLIDPLSELVKISPGHLGIGLYQHDIKARHLADSLDEVVMECVNYVGVNANTASPSLLRYVSGLNQLTARRLYEFRQTRPVTNREEIREVPGIGEATFVQAAGFIRVYGGENPLDETSIHPESYPIAVRVLEKVGIPASQWLERKRASATDPPAVPVSPGSDPAPLAADPGVSAEAPPSAPPPDVPAGSGASAEPVAVGDGSAAGGNGDSATQPSASQVADRPPPAPAFALDASTVAALAALDIPALAREMGIGELAMRDIVENLCRPRRDPRLSLPPPIFRSGILGFDDLRPDMQLTAQVINVVDFGVFVDVGLGHTCLVHVSELSRGFIRDIHEVWAVGDILTTWVRSIDPERRRVKLSALPPGSERFERRGRRGHRSERPGADQAPAAGQEPGQTADQGRREGPPRDRRGRGPGQQGERQGQQAAGSGSGPPRSAGHGSSSRPGQQRGQFGQQGGAPGTGHGDRNRTGRGSRPPRRADQRRQEQARSFERKPARPKFIKPLDEDVLQGRKPMRSFSDLAQFFQKKDEPPKPPE